MITNRTYGMDADVLAYNARIVAGGNQSLSMQSLRQLNQFIISIKKMSLWYNMVCWPLRANQNAGSGSITYSIGGLQIPNGTQDGIWTTNGISLSSTQQMSANLNDVGQNITMLFCGAGDGSTYGSFPMIFGVQSSSTWVSNEIRFSSNGGAPDAQGFHRNSTGDFLTNTAISNGMSNSRAFTFNSISSAIGGSILVRNLRTRTSAGGVAPSSGTAIMNRLQINGRWSSSSLALANPMTVAFCAIFLPNITNSIDSVYSVYKTTIGQDLGLP